MSKMKKKSQIKRKKLKLNLLRLILIFYKISNNQMNNRIKNKYKNKKLI